MRKLSDYEGEGGKWLGDGWHDVTITGHTVGESEVKATPYVEFAFENPGGQAKMRFYLAETIIWRLAEFVKSCGLTGAEMEGYDVDSQASHRHLKGKKVAIEIARQTRGDAKYGEVIEYQHVDAAKPAPRLQPPQQANPAPAGESKEDIPF